MSLTAPTIAIASLLACGLSFGIAATGRGLGAQDGKPAETIDAELRETLDDMAARGAQITQLTADFEQRRHTPLLREPLVSTGRVEFTRDGTLWTTTHPRPTVMLVTDKELRLYYPDDKLLEIYNIAQRGGELALSPVPRLDVLERHFAIAATPPNAVEESMQSTVASGTDIAIRLTPCTEALAEFVRHIDIIANRESACVTRADMLDQQGERTVMVFSNVEVSDSKEIPPLTLMVPADTRISRPLEGSR